MEEEIKMAETVMLIDASFLNFVTEDIKKNFERMLNRDLWLISKDFLKIISEKNVLVSTVIVRKTKPEAINRKRIFSCTRRGGAFFSLLGK